MENERLEKTVMELAARVNQLEVRLKTVKDVVTQQHAHMLTMGNHLTRLQRHMVEVNGLKILEDCPTDKPV